MPLRSRKPTSPGRRFQTVSDFSEVTAEADTGAEPKASGDTGDEEADADA